MAADLARGELLLLLLNNDTLVGDHALDRLAESFQREPDAGVARGRSGVLMGCRRRWAGSISA